jgi:hypothetical protein
MGLLSPAAHVDMAWSPAQPGGSVPHLPAIAIACKFQDAPPGLHCTLASNHIPLDQQPLIVVPGDRRIDRGQPHLWRPTFPLCHKMEQARILQSMLHTILHNV